MASRRRRAVVWTFLGVVVLFLLLSSTIAYYYTEVLWFDELGFRDIFVTRALARAILGVVAGLVFALFLWINLRIVRATIMQLWSQAEELGFGGLIRPRIIDRVSIVVSGVFGLLAGISFSTEWEMVLRFINRVPFEIADPIFGRDVGFYIFTLPVYQLIFGSLSFLLLFALVIMALIYFFSGSINFLGGRINVHPKTRLHLGGLLASYFVVRAWGYWLDAYDLLYSPRGVAFGASYADIYAQLPALRIMAVIALFAAALTFWYVRARDIRWIYAALILMVIGSVGLVNGYPMAVQRLVVEPNELAREATYIEHNIDYTTKAYGMEEVDERQFPAVGTLAWSDLEDNWDTIENTRIWDWRPLVTTYRQLHSIRAYYEFLDADVGRYEIDGDYRQVLLSPRQINSSKIPGAQTWVNQRLQYTHGNGIIMSPASEVNENGLPVMFIEDIPPSSNVDLEVENPSIYYGEGPMDYVIANSLEPEIHYPEGDRNVHIQYEGDGGVALGGILRRSAFSLRFGDYNILISGALRPEARVMYYRSIQDRIRHIAPFLLLDEDPYIALNEETGGLVWIQDAYTHSSRYPYSEPYGGRLNYIRNSVKIVVDAYDGETTFYVFDREDPMLQTYRNIFPDMFVDAEEMPEQLQTQVRYPIDLFNVQMDMYRTYHMTDPTVFYNKEDLWEIPEEMFAGTAQRMEPYYVMMRLPDNDRLEFIQMIPFTPSGRDVMVGWMAARSDGDRYGELLVYNMPRDKTVLGPRQIEARIDQNAEISQLFTLWGQGGSSVIRGNLLVIPIADSLLYIEPVYLEATDTAVPELRRIIVAHADRVAMGRTLDEALEILFGVRPEVEGPDAPGGPMTDIELIIRAYELYDDAQEALRLGEWSRYGDLMDELGEALDDLSEDLPTEGQEEQESTD
ncbi:MAG: UPF0182 family protein [Bacillota bacterium]